MLHIYYGLGKGKTSTLNGSLLRAQGAGMKVAIFRFLKGRETNEDKEIKKLGIEVFSFQSSLKFVLQMNPEEREKAKAEVLSGLNLIRTQIHKYDLIAIDEILDLTVGNVGFITPKELKEFLEEIKKGKEVLISGHEYNKEVFAIADLITKYKPEKHYFDQGIKAREGIEF